MILNFEKIGNGLRTKDFIQAKDGNEYIIDFAAGREFQVINGKMIQKGHTKLYADFYRYDEQGCWGNTEFENKIFKSDFSFNEKDILKAVNLVTYTKYKKVVID